MEIYTNFFNTLWEWAWDGWATLVLVGMVFAEHLSVTKIKFLYFSDGFLYI